MPAAPGNNEPMTIAFPEHRICTYLAFLQMLAVTIGTFAVRLATTETAREFYGAPPALALWVREWGFLLLLLPVGWLVWTLRAERRDVEGDKSGWRLAAGIAVTVALFVLFWALWEKSTHRMISPLTAD